MGKTDSRALPLLLLVNILCISRQLLFVSRFGILVPSASPVARLGNLTVLNVPAEPIRSPNWDVELVHFF